MLPGTTLFGLIRQDRSSLDLFAGICDGSRIHGVKGDPPQSCLRLALRKEDNSYAFIS